MSDLEYVTGALLKEKGLTLGVVESGTGGLISHLITNVPGSSNYYKGSVTAYSNEIKRKIIGVKSATLEKYGAVSPQVAIEMADGGRKVLGVDICLADTGIAGPGGGTLEKPVGLFYIGLAHKGGAFSRKYELTGSRLEIKQKVAEAALGWLREYLESL